MTKGRVLELFGVSTRAAARPAWKRIVRKQWCPFANSRCFKVRKSQPDVSIGTCTVRYGRDEKDLLICPNRLLERKQVLTDCIHLLTLHEPGNEFHVVPEVRIPGGTIDYFLTSVNRGKVADFVAVEFQTLDSTGTVWPERQRFLSEQGFRVPPSDIATDKGFGMNWKMTAKTTLVQLHHKVETFEGFAKHIVLVVQDHLLDYMRREFSFGHLHTARVGDPMHFHSYRLGESDGAFRLELDARLSTDAAGIAKCLGLQAEAKVDLASVIAQLETKLATLHNTLLVPGEGLPS